MDWKEISRQLVEGLKTNGMALVPIVPPTMEGPRPRRGPPLTLKMEAGQTVSPRQVRSFLWDKRKGDRRAQGAKAIWALQRAGDVVHVGVARIVPERVALRYQRVYPESGEIATLPKENDPCSSPSSPDSATAASIPSAIESTGNILGDVGVDLTGKARRRGRIINEQARSMVLNDLLEGLDYGDDKILNELLSRSRLPRSWRREHVSPAERDG